MQNPKGCWRMCIAAALAQFCTIGLNINVFSVYIPYLTELLELSYNQNSAFMLVRNLCSVSSVYLAKYFYDKLEIRIGYTLVLILNVIGVALYASADCFGLLCVAAAVSGLSYGLGGIYPTAILIHRWFPCHEGLAMGICAASSGLALTIGAPIITALSEKFSLQYAMYCEIGFLLVIVVTCFILIQNYPDGEMHYTFRPKSIRHPFKFSWTQLAMVAIGILAGSFSYLTIHYKTEGFDPYKVSTIISIIGLVLTCSKFLLGELLDLVGACKVNWIYLSLSVLSCICFTFGNSFGFSVAIIGAVLYGIGDAVATVGVPAYAKDLSKPGEYAATQQQYQTAFLSGGLICALITGPIATVTGNYRTFYLLVTIILVAGSAIIQSSYWKRMKEN